MAMMKIYASFPSWDRRPWALCLNLYPRCSACLQELTSGELPTSESSDLCS